MTSQLTMSETLESLLTDRKILLFRYDANLRKEIFKKLTTLQKKLLTRLSAAGIESISKSELNKLLKDIKVLIEDTYSDVNAYSNEELNSLLPIETAATVKIYNDSVKFDLFNAVPEKTVKAAKNADIISGTPLKDWWDKQGNDLAFKFSALITQGMIDGKQTSQLITETKELLGSSRRGAETLVRTAVMKVHDKAQELFRDENLDLLKGEKHLSTLDTRTSEVCRVRDGLAWDLDKKPIGDHSVPYARPPLHPNCRSTLILITKSWKELGLDMDEIPESTRASMDGQVKASLTYEDWLKNKTPEQQNAILGNGKADLWRKGVITFRDMLDQSGRPLTLKQLSVKFGNGVLEKELSLNSTTIELLDDLKTYNIEYRPVQMLSSKLSSDDIIAKLAGGDETKGSCASLALSYIGNRIGLDVTDYRGGESCDFFSRDRNVNKLFSAKGVTLKVFDVIKEASEVASILETELTIGKEYYLSAGTHAAIVRRGDKGLEYLELQSNNKNGWTSFSQYGSTIRTLNKRFGCALKAEMFNSIRGKKAFIKKAQLAEVDSFKNAEQDLKEVLGYLNTAAEQQKKGSLGGVK